MSEYTNAVRKSLSGALYDNASGLRGTAQALLDIIESRDDVIKAQTGLIKDLQVDADKAQAAHQLEVDLYLASIEELENTLAAERRRPEG